jgi:hypothetical protein
LADPEWLEKMVEAVDKASTPVQFGIGTLLVITTMYAVLFASLRVLHAPPSVFVVIALLFTVVGLGQTFLYKGQRPRRASMIAGACFFVGLYVIYRVAFGDEYLYHFFAPFDPVEGAFFGAIYGYVAGLLISGAFLVVDKAKRLQGRSKGIDRADEVRT